MRASFNEQGIINQSEALEAGHEQAGICTTGYLAGLADTVWMWAKHQEGGSRNSCFLRCIGQPHGAASGTDETVWMGNCSYQRVGRFWYGV